MGCHFLLQCMKVKSEREVAQSCPTLRDPMDCSLPGSSVRGISRQEYWSGLPLPSPNHILFIIKKDPHGQVIPLLLSSKSFLGEGNGNPLQCSCLENPRDWGAWWAAVYGVSQSRAQLKQLSSSSSSEQKQFPYRRTGLSRWC